MELIFGFQLELEGVHEGDKVLCMCGEGNGEETRSGSCSGGVSCPGRFTLSERNCHLAASSSSPASSLRSTWLNRHLVPPNARRWPGFLS